MCPANDHSIFLIQQFCIPFIYWGYSDKPLVAANVSFSESLQFYTCNTTCCSAVYISYCRFIYCRSIKHQDFLIDIKHGGRTQQNPVPLSVRAVNLRSNFVVSSYLKTVRYHIHLRRQINTKQKQWYKWKFLGICTFLFVMDAGKVFVVRRLFRWSCLVEGFLLHLWCQWILSVTI